MAEDLIMSEHPTTLRHDLLNLAAELASSGEMTEAIAVLCTALRDAVNLDPLRKPHEYSLTIRTIGLVLSRLPDSESLRNAQIRMFAKLLSRPRAPLHSEVPALMEAFLHAVEGGPDAALAALGRREMQLPREGKAIELLRKLRSPGISDGNNLEIGGQVGIDQILKLLPDEFQPEWIWKERVSHGFLKNFKEFEDLKFPGRYRGELLLIFLEMNPEDLQALESASCDCLAVSLWDAERVSLWYRLYWSNQAAICRKTECLKISAKLLQALPSEVVTDLPESRDAILARIQSLEISSS